MVAGPSVLESECPWGSGTWRGFGHVSVACAGPPPGWLTEWSRWCRLLPAHQRFTRISSVRPLPSSCPPSPPPRPAPGGSCRTRLLTPGARCPLCRSLSRARCLRVLCSVFCPNHRSSVCSSPVLSERAGPAPQAGSRPRPASLCGWCPLGLATGLHSPSSSPTAQPCLQLPLFAFSVSGPSSFVGEMFCAGDGMVSLPVHGT